MTTFRSRCWRRTVCSPGPRARWEITTDTAYRRKISREQWPFSCTSASCHGMHKGYFRVPARRTFDKAFWGRGICYRSSIAKSQVDVEAYLLCSLPAFGIRQTVRAEALSCASLSTASVADGGRARTTLPPRFLLRRRDRHRNGREFVFGLSVVDNGERYGGRAGLFADKPERPVFGRYRRIDGQQ